MVSKFPHNLLDQVLLVPELRINPNKTTTQIVILLFKILIILHQFFRLVRLLIYQPLVLFIFQQLACQILDLIDLIRIFIPQQLKLILQALILCLWIRSLQALIEALHLKHSIALPLFELIDSLLALDLHFTHLDVNHFIVAPKQLFFLLQVLVLARSLYHIHLQDSALFGQLYELLLCIVSSWLLLQLGYELL